MPQAHFTFYPDFQFLVCSISAATSTLRLNTASPDFQHFLRPAELVFQWHRYYQFRAIHLKGLNHRTSCGIHHSKSPSKLAKKINIS